MKMKRRSFLKGLVAGITGAAMGSSAIAKDLSKPKYPLYNSLDEFLKEMRKSWRKTYAKLLGNDGKEISGKGYARAEITAEDWDIKNGTAKNNKTILFPKAKQDWGEISGYIISDSKDNPLIICKFPFANRKSINKGDDSGFLPGEICVELS